MKKILSGILAASIVASMGVASFADVPANPTTSRDPLDNGKVTFGDYVYNDEYKVEAKMPVNGTTIDEVRPDTTYYIPITGISNAKFELKGFQNTNVVGEKDYFKFSVDKDGDGKSLIESVSLVSDKKADDVGSDTSASTTVRGSWLKVVTKQSFADSEKKAKITVEFKTKSADDADLKKDLGNIAVTGSAEWVAGDVFSTTLNFWVKNATEDGEDVDVETGDGFVFKPTSNEENVIIWGDDRAALKFDADDDASKFYAKMSTKALSGFWAEYADPVGADVWFYDFVGNPSVPSTSRATLTLGIPWDEDDDYAPMVEDVYIYMMDADGVLTDVTSQFEYSEDAAEIAGWTTRTRTLGTYIVSDMELPIDVAEEEDTSSDVEDTTTPNTEGDKEIPSTGSADMVNVAVVAAVVSLAAAGAVAFRKK